MALKPRQASGPLPRWVWWCASVFLFLVVSVLVFLFVSEGRGRAQWEGFRSEWEAKGEVFEWAAYIPPPIPDVENLAMAPVLRDLKAIERAGLNQLPDYKGSDELGWIDGRIKDLTASFPALSQQEASKVIATAMDERAGLLAELTAATRERSKCRFPLDYEIGVRFDIKPVVGVRWLSVLCHYRSLWYRSQGKIDQSFDDWITAVYMARAIETVPSQLGFLIYRAEFHRLLQPIWELLHTHQLDENQLEQAQAILADQHFIKKFLHQARIERALVMHGIDQLILGNSSMAQVWGTNGPLFTHYPKGWWYEDKLTYCDRQNRAYLYPNGVKAIDTLDFAHCQQVEHAIQEEISSSVSRFLPKNLSSNIAATQMSNFASGALRTETNLRLLRLAIALEQHYQKHQQFPPSLDALLPDGLPAIPLDPIDQQPLRYRPDPDFSGYLLYGIGTDGQDDGGTQADNHAGDWIWPMPSRDDQ